MEPVGPLLCETQKALKGIAGPSRPAGYSNPNGGISFSPRTRSRRRRGRSRGRGREGSLLRQIQQESGQPHQALPVGMHQLVGGRLHVPHSTPAGFPCQRNSVGAAISLAEAFLESSQMLIPHTWVYSNVDSAHLGLRRVSRDNPQLYCAHP
jgi:hypothetical protein